MTNSILHTVSVAQAGNVWHWVRWQGACRRVSRERFASEPNAVAAAFSIAMCHDAALDVTPRQWSMVIAWLSEGQDAFRRGLGMDTLRNVVQREGWHMEAVAEAVRQEADSKPGLGDAPISLTLEEAIRVQMRRNAATLAESRHLEAR
jgi:hypothetical protein